MVFIVYERFHVLFKFQILLNILIEQRKELCKEKHCKTEFTAIEVGYGALILFPQGYLYLLFSRYRDHVDPLSDSEC